MAKKKERYKLTKEQQDKLLGFLFLNYPKPVIERRFKEEEGIEISDWMFYRWERRIKEEQEEAIERAQKHFEKQVFGKYLSQREARIDILMAEVTKALAFKVDEGDHLAFERRNTVLTRTLKQIAQELHEWRTGDTTNIVYNIISPVFEQLAFVLVRHITEGDARDAALADLRRVSHSYLEGLPDAKVIPAKSKAK